MRPPEPDLSVIVACRNERDHVEACVRSILEQDLPAEHFEVVIADGMSDDGTRGVLERHPQAGRRLRVIDNVDRTVSAGLNAAIRAARGRVIVRMDAHTTYAPDYLRQCLRVLDETGADNVGGPWVAHGRGRVGRAIAAAFQSPFAAGGARGHDPDYEGLVDTVYLGCWPRRVFEWIGGFDESLVRNQDDEFNLRLTRAGGRIWQSPGIRSEYHPRESFPGLARQYAQYGYWKVRVIQKHGRPGSVRHLVPATFVLLLGLLPAAGVWWPPALGAWLALVGLYVTCNLAVSLRAAAGGGRDLLPLLPIAFACYHLSYGYGFLQGVCDFLILRRPARGRYAELTRASMPAAGTSGGGCSA